MAVVPSYPRDYEFHHLAVRFPFRGEERYSQRFEYNNAEAQRLDHILQNDHLWMLRRLGRRVWLVRGIHTTEPFERSPMMATKREVIPDRTGKDDETGTPILGEEMVVPGFLRFSTLPDPGLFQWAGGCYLSRNLSYFPRLETFSYHQLRFPPDDPTRVYNPQLAFSGFFAYMNGGTLEQLMVVQDKRYREFTFDPDDLDRRCMSLRLPESLIWHVINEVGKALVKLQTGLPRDATGEEDRVNGRTADDPWRPIVHGRITPENIYLDFDELALADSNPDTRVKAQCFPRIVLGNFSTADFAVDDLSEEWYTWYRNNQHRAYKEGHVLPGLWWDIYFFGLLIRKMLLFGDTGIADPPGGLRTRDQDLRAPYPDYLEEEVLGLIPHSTARYLDRNRAHADDPKHPFYNPGYREWSSDLVMAAHWFEHMLRDAADTNLSPNKHFIDAEARGHLPELAWIQEEPLPLAKRQLDAFMNSLIEDLVKPDNTESVIFNWTGPRQHKADTMVYRPKHKVGNVHREMEIYNSQDAVMSDMQGFPGPWSYLFVNYDPYHISLNDSEDEESGGEGTDPDVLTHGVLPFGDIRDKGQRAPDAPEDDGGEDPYGDPLGKVVQEQLRRKWEKDGEAREIVRRNESKKPKRTVITREEEEQQEEDAVDNDQLALEKAQFDREEEAFQRRKRQAEWENRGDTLLEVRNAILLQGESSRPENVDRGFWERWREGSADSIQLIN